MGKECLEGMLECVGVCRERVGGVEGCVGVCKGV